MNDNDVQIKRLIRWNRFWLILFVTLVTVIGGLGYLAQRVTLYAFRLQLRWTHSVNGRSEDAIEVSSVGGPFIITHLAFGSNERDTVGSAIAQLPHPLFLRPKSHEDISLRGLVWINSEGKRVVTPKFNTPVQALYYKVQTVSTTQ